MFFTHINGQCACITVDLQKSAVFIEGGTICGCPLNLSTLVSHLGRHRIPYQIAEEDQYKEVWHDGVNICGRGG